MRPPTLPTEKELARRFAGYDAACVWTDLATGETVRLNPAGCRERAAPCSTFKIPNALIGLETGVLTGPDHRMKWDGVKRPIATWNRDHTLRTAFRESAVWYFQRVAARVGEKRMAAHLSRIPYGNRDTSGGLTRFWLESSLLISPDEQAAFVERLAEGGLPFSPRSLSVVRDLMVVESRGGVVLRGKTGTGGNPRTGRATLGWFVGYVTRGARVQVFAARLRGGANPSGRQARALIRQIAL